MSDVFIPFLAQTNPWQIATATFAVAMVAYPVLQGLKLLASWFE
jgi:hypothetical protein